MREPPALASDALKYSRVCDVVAMPGSRSAFWAKNLGQFSPSGRSCSRGSPAAVRYCFAAGRGMKISTATTVGVVRSAAKSVPLGKIGGVPNKGQRDSKQTADDILRPADRRHTARRYQPAPRVVVGRRRMRLSAQMNRVPPSSPQATLPVRAWVRMVPRWAPSGART